MENTLKLESCPCCGNKEIEDFETYTNFPSFLFPVDGDLLNKIESGDLTLNYCKNCAHIFSSNIDQNLLNKIYTSYYSDYPFDADESFFSYYREPFKNFFNLVADNLKLPQQSKKLLEIGCSKPSNLNQFVEKGYLCTGVDPSPLSNTVSVNKNIHLISSYYEATRFDEKFNIIVSRFNLEHIVDLSLHTQKIFEDLDDNGTLIIQVPNVSYYLENRQPFFAAHEHLHYFSESSLNILLENSGFRLISIFSRSQPSILACYKKKLTHNDLFDESYDFPTGLKSWMHNKSLTKLKLNEALKPNMTVIFYGCGLSLFWALENINFDNCENLKIIIVDDNPNYIKKYLPCYNFEVLNPNSINFAEADLIVLTMNPFFRPNVKSKIKKYCQNIQIFDEI